MNIRQVLRTYSLLRQLTDDETALLETLRSLNDTERESLVVALQPEKVTTRKPSTERKIEHCVACDYTKRAAVHKDSSLKDYHEFVSAKEEKEEKKSKRAAGMARTIKENLAQREPMVSNLANDTDTERCTVMRDGRVCGLLPDHNVHHMQSAIGYHEFDAGKSPAPRAATRSSTNGGVTNSTASSATEPEGVSNAVHAGG